MQHEYFYLTHVLLFSQPVTAFWTDEFMIDGKYDKQQWNSFTSGSSNSNNAKVSFQIDSDWRTNHKYKLILRLLMVI